MIKITITSNEANQRLDRFLKKYLKRAPLSVIYKMIRKDIKVNGKRVRENTMLNEGDELVLYTAEETLNHLTAPVKRKAAKRQFKIAYEDENVIIVDKPEGLLTHGDAHEKKNTLVNQVCGYLMEKGEYLPSREKTFIPAPVNRLDRNTTGLVIFGKNAASLRILTALLREGEHIEKYYQTIVYGQLDEELTLEDKLYKDHDRNLSKVADDGKSAKTMVRPLETGKMFSLAEVRLFTGRTHQIRVHLSNAGFPLAGDVKYGDRKANKILKEQGITTQLLHAYKLKFRNMPEELKLLEGKEVEAKPPADFERMKDRLVIQKSTKGY